MCVPCDQVAQQKMSQLLTSRESLGSLGGAPQASLQTLAAILTLNAGQQPLALQEADPQDIKLSLYQLWGAGDALRYELSTLLELELSADISASQPGLFCMLSAFGNCWYGESSGV